MRKVTKKEQLIVYRDFGEDRLLEKMEQVMLYYDMAGEELPDDLWWESGSAKGDYCECIHELIDLTGNYGFRGNLWHAYLTHHLVNNENAFSKACEIRGAVEGSINELVKHDFTLFKELYDYDFSEMENALGIHFYGLISDYQNVNEDSKIFNRRIRDRICNLSEKLGKAKDIQEFMEDMTSFYKDFGVGKLGLHKAFRIAHTDEGAQIVPITNITHVHLDDLVGYEIAKKKLIDNTEAFVHGRKANNCLLFGDAGTGKSSSIKGILNKY